MAAPEYVKQAPSDEVLFEQLDYLLLHRETCVIENCACCVRLGKAERSLMTPFWVGLDE